MKALCSPIGLVLLACAAPLSASVTVASPQNGATVTAVFTLNASASPCSNQAIAAMGYSFDNSSTTIPFYSSSIATTVTAPTGSHVLHVKSWGNQGASCVADVQLQIVPVPAAAAAPVTNVTVTAPTNNAVVLSPLTVSASGTQCSSQPISAFGYSLDNSSNTTFAMGNVLNGSVTATVGTHVLHVKSWGPNNAACDTDLTINVVAPPVASGPVIPSNAVAVKAIQNSSAWKADFDTATTGSSTGAMTMVTAPSLSGSSRQFLTNYSYYAGERYYTNFGADTKSTNFVYDGWIYLAGPANDIGVIEMDLNQVMSNGQTVIFGFQCDGWSRTWDYTINAGTATAFNDQWVHSNQTCNPQSWAPNLWHHVQISYSRDGSGNITYKSVWLDGKEQDLDATAFSSFALGWGPALVTNLQIGGFTSTPGSSTVYLDNLTVYSW